MPVSAFHCHKYLLRRFFQRSCHILLLSPITLLLSQTSYCLLVITRCFTNRSVSNNAWSLLKLIIYEKGRKPPLRKTRGSFFQDAKTQLISNFFKVSKPGMQSRVNFRKSRSSSLIFSHAFRRYKPNKQHPGSKTTPP